MGRVNRIDLQVYTFLDPFSALAQFVMSQVADADYRSSLGHSVTGDERQLEFLHEELFKLLRNGCSAGGEHLYASAKRLVEDDFQGIAEIRIVLVVFEFGCAALAVDEFAQSVLDEFGKNQRD